MNGNLLVHYHIYKNAGTSIDLLLFNTFGQSWTNYEGPDDTAALPPAALLAFIKKNPGLRAISSHRARPPVPLPNISPIVMLRHPIDRARSIFHFARRDAGQFDHAIARATDFRGYIEWALSPEGAGVPVRDYQVTHLSDASFRNPDAAGAPARPSDLAQAKSFLATLPAFGLVRRFADSCLLFDLHYRPRFPGLRLTNVQENPTANATLTEAQALDQSRVELGETVFHALLAANRLDMALYEHAQNAFHHNLTNISLKTRTRFFTTRAKTALRNRHQRLRQRLGIASL